MIRMSADRNFGWRAFIIQSLKEMRNYAEGLLHFYRVWLGDFDLEILIFRTWASRSYRLKAYQFSGGRLLDS